MLETNDAQPATADDVVPSSETVERVDGQQPGATDTPEQEAETDEQKNARVLQEQEQRQQRKRDAVQRRFDEMTARDKAKDRQIEQLLSVLQNTQQPQRGAQAPNADERPQRGSDEPFEDFLRREARWEAKQEAGALVRKALQDRQQQEQMGQLTQRAEQVRAEFVTRVQEFAKSKPDWEAVVANNDDVDLPDATIGLLHIDDEGPALMYAIGANPKLAAELQAAARADGNGSPVRQARVLGRIAASLARPPAVSKAPLPGSPVGSRGAPTGNAPADNDSVEVWLKKRAAQLKAR